MHEPGFLKVTFVSFLTEQSCRSLKYLEAHVFWKGLKQSIPSQKEKYVDSISTVVHSINWRITMEVVKHDWWPHGIRHRGDWSGDPSPFFLPSPTALLLSVRKDIRSYTALSGVLDAVCVSVSPSAVPHWFMCDVTYSLIQWHRERCVVTYSCCHQITHVKARKSGNSFQ